MSDAVGGTALAISSEVAAGAAATAGVDPFVFRLSIFVLAILLADLLYAWLDPRIRYDKK